ncbi:hypothetical protein I316_03207 [Kwoniella heveanensis BCC8398]|uniref:Uncharacterized protein n=1 Tax=Kwoniella heveanensis BCC8398 TaxID=1296120 RepID=A0A1B9GW76_9TREE|nr:hypothetical protein I316_03207 [Kwoniella heveanensis BCC8398]
MQLGRYSVSTLRPPPIHSITFSEDDRYFSVAGEEGYEVWRTWPLALVRRRVLPGTLAKALMLPGSPLLVLQGGGAAPLYSPNKAVIYHDKIGAAIAEIEFGERIRGISARRGTICIALSRKTIAFDASFRLEKVGEWETAQNELGLMALSTAPGSALLALPGRQPGHVQLISLSRCPSPSAASSTSQPSSTSAPSTSFRSPIILAHTHPLSTLSASPSGSHLMTTSERGTLLRVWDTARGRLERELRRGVDRAEIWGAKFDAPSSTDEASHGNTGVIGGGKGRVVGWSDKGTVHVWGDQRPRSSGEDGSRPSTPTSSAPSLTHLLSRNLPLPKYFSSTASSAQYHLPRKNPHAISAALGAAGVNVPSMKAEDEGDESERFVVGWVDVEVPSPLPSHSGADKYTKGTYEGVGVGSGGGRPVRRSSGIYTEGGTGLSASPTMGAGIGNIGLGMGTRGERRSFESGSDGTSRTATPPLRGGTPTPSSMSHGIGRRNSTLSTTTTAVGTAAGTAAGSRLVSGFLNKSSAGEVPGVRVKSPSNSDPPNLSSTASKISSALKATTDRTERQLVAVTYSGDWYRLRLPQQANSAYQVSGSESSSSGSGGGVSFEGVEEGERARSRGGGGRDEGDESRRGNKCELVEYRRLGTGGGGW